MSGGIIWHILLLGGLCGAFILHYPVKQPSNRFQQSKSKGYQRCSNLDSTQPLIKIPLGHWHLIEVGDPVTDFDQDILRGQALPGNTAIEFCETDGSYRSFLLPGDIPLRLKQLSFMEVRGSDAVPSYACLTTNYRGRAGLATPFGTRASP